METVDPEAVFLFGNYTEQPRAEVFELRIVYPALEDRVLNALPEVLTGRGNFS